VTQVAVASLCLFSGIIGAFIAWAVTHQPLGSVLRDRVRTSVIVTLKTSETYFGVLLEADAHAFVLGSAYMLKPDGGRLAVDGEIVILRPDIAYVQKP
jgi:small nuclear ribonucleoprotein (snRNP)-like protein